MFVLNRKSRVLPICAVLLLGTVTSCNKFDRYQDQIAIPCAWHTSLNTEMMDQGACYRWWESFQDPTLTKLIEEEAVRNYNVRLAASQSREQLLDAVNVVASDIAQSYIEWRGSQRRLSIIQESIAVQENSLKIGQGLLEKGFIDTFNQTEYQTTLNALLAQKAGIELVIKKAIFHLANLLNYTPEEVQEALNQAGELPELPCAIAVECPDALVHRHPGIREARKLYKQTGSKEAFYLYQKKVLMVLEEIQDALAYLKFASEKATYLENNESLKKESYQQTKDLIDRGQKDELDALSSQQAFLVQQDLLVQSKIDLLTGYVHLYRALSLGWEVYYCGKKC